MKRWFKKTLNKRPNKKKIVLVSILTAIAVVMLFALVNRQIAYSRPCGPNPNNSLYDEVAKVIKDGKADELSALNDRIRSTKNFEGSINCLYPLFVQSVRSGDTYTAQVYLNNMNKLSIQAKRVSPEYKEVGFSSITDIQKQLSEAEQKQSDSYNAEYF